MVSVQPQPAEHDLHDHLKVHVVAGMPSCIPLQVPLLPVDTRL